MTTPKGGTSLDPLSHVAIIRGIPIGSNPPVKGEGKGHTQMFLISNPGMKVEEDI